MSVLLPRKGTYPRERVNPPSRQPYHRHETHGHVDVIALSNKNNRRQLDSHFMSTYFEHEKKIQKPAASKVTQGYVK